MPPNGVVTPESCWTLAEYTSASLIIPRLEQRDKPGAIKELSQALQTGGRVPDMLLFYNEVLNREFLVNTAMEYGIAFPHARAKNVKSLCFALGRAADPIAWGPRGTLPVRLIFLMAVPPSEAGNYLYLLSGLARIARENDWLDGLCRAESVNESLDLLRQIKIRPRQGSLNGA